MSTPEPTDVGKLDWMWRSIAPRFEKKLDAALKAVVLKPGQEAVYDPGFVELTTTSRLQHLINTDQWVEIEKLMDEHIARHVHIRNCEPVQD